MSLTTLLYALGFIVLGGIVFLLAALLFGRGEDLPPLPAEGTPTELPDLRPVSGADARSVRLPVTVRGYRMADTDWVIEKLADAIDERDHEIARLRADLQIRGDPPDYLDDDPRPGEHGPTRPAVTSDTDGPSPRVWQAAAPAPAERRSGRFDDPAIDE